MSKPQLILISPSSLPLDSLILVAFGDSAFANAPGGKSQGRFLITAITEEATRRETYASRATDTGVCFARLWHLKRQV